MKRLIKKTLSVIGASLLALTAMASLAQMPNLINYQGRIMDAEGQPKTGTVNLSFEMYDSAVDGTKVWGPQVFTNVPLKSGYFNVILGDLDSNGKSIVEAFNTPAAYIMIIDGANPVLPRQQILSSVFAFKAQYAERSGDAVPTGSIMAYYGNTAPAGYLMCDGSAIDAQYTDLIALVGANTPDLRGRFLRGLDPSGTIDPDGESRSVGTMQEDGIKKHVHSVPNVYNNFDIEGQYGAMPYSTSRRATPQATWASVDDVKFEDETRPKNMAVNYIIKI